MTRKSLFLVGSAAAALVLSAAAQAAPGETTGNVHMRAGPGTKYRVIATIPSGTAVDIGNCASWCAVSYAGRDGYVSGRFVAQVGSAKASLRQRHRTASDFNRDYADPFLEGDDIFYYGPVYFDIRGGPGAHH